jgi:hypothetical protein
MIGPGKAFDTDHFFVVSYEPSRWMPRDDWALVRQSGDRPAIRIGFSGHYRG